MADIQWIKITTDIFDDEKILLIEELPDADSLIVIWFKLLCLAGKQNNNGVFLLNDRIPYTEKMLATIFRRKQATVHLALQVFEEFGMIEVINGAITIPNWDKHQNLDSLDRIREQTRKRVAKHREKQKLLTAGAGGNVTSNVSVTDGNAIEKNKKREDQIRSDNTTATGLSEAERDALDEFIKMRKAIKKPMTDRAITILLKKLNELGNTEAERVAILNQSIEHCWQTVYPLKDEKSKSGGYAGKKNEFHNFQQHEYSDEDFKALERALDN